MAKEWISIPVIINGGIFSLSDAKKCLGQSGADGLMIGRAAAVEPWIFSDIASSLFGFEADSEKKIFPDFIWNFISYLCHGFPKKDALED